MKKMFALVMVVVMLLTVSGCNLVAQPTATDAGTPPSETMAATIAETTAATAAPATQPVAAPTNPTKEVAVTVTETVPQEPTQAETEPTETEPVPQNKIRLNRMDITFTYAGEPWMLYSGDVDKSLVSFTSGDTSVATFENGRVVAVGNGTTTVYASYGDEKVSCIIRCNFQESTGVAGNGGVSEDG